MEYKYTFLNSVGKIGLFANFCTLPVFEYTCDEFCVFAHLPALSTCLCLYWKDNHAKQNKTKQKK